MSTPVIYDVSGYGNDFCKNSITTKILAGKKVSSDTYADLSLVSFGSTVNKSITANLTLQNEATPKLNFATTGITPTTVGISGVTDPAAAQDVATKKYVDDRSVAISSTPAKHSDMLLYNRDTSTWTPSTRLLTDEFGIDFGKTNAKKVENFVDLMVPTTFSMSAGSVTTAISFNDTTTPMMRMVGFGDIPSGSKMNDIFLKTKNYINASPSLTASPQGSMNSPSTEDTLEILFMARSHYPVSNNPIDTTTSFLDATGPIKLNVRFLNDETSGIDIGTYKLAYKTGTVSPFNIKVYMLADTEGINAIDYYMSNTSLTVPISTTPGWSQVLSTDVTVFNSLQEVSFTTASRYSMACIVTDGPSKFGVLTITQQATQYRANLSSTLDTSTGVFNVTTSNTVAGSILVEVLPNLTAAYVLNTASKVVRTPNSIVLKDAADNKSTSLTAKKLTIEDVTTFGIYSSTDINNALFSINNATAEFKRSLTLPRRNCMVNTKVGFPIDATGLNYSGVDVSNATTFTVVKSNIFGNNAPFTLQTTSPFRASAPFRLSFSVSFNVNMNVTHITFGFTVNSTPTNVIYRAVVPLGAPVTFTSTGVVQLNATDNIQFGANIVGATAPGDIIDVTNLVFSIEEDPSIW